MTKVVLKGSFLGLQKFTKLYASKYFLLVMLIFGLVVLLLPNILRENPFMSGEEGFYHLKIAKDVLEGRDWGFLNEGLGYLIAGVSFITKLSIEESAKVLFLIFGLGSLCLIYLLFRLLDIKEGMMGLPIIIISPAFIYLFSVINSFAIPMLLVLLMSYFLLKKRFYLSGIFFILLPFFSYAFTIFILVFGILYWLYKKRNKFILFILSLILLGWLLTFKGFNFDFISDFGGDLGLSIFGVFIVLIGLGFFWKKKKFIQLYIITFLLFLVYLKLYWVIFLLNIPFCLLIAFSLVNLLKVEWESDLIKDLTVFILICGLLFSGVSFIKALGNSEPNEEFFDALSVVPRGSVILSHPMNNNWIDYAGMGIIEGNLTGLFKTRDFKLAIKILNENDVDYILITEKMRRLVWEDDEEGLLFLLKYSDNFDRIYEGNIEVWKYLRE